MTDTKYNLADLVIARLQTLAEDQEISIGSEGKFSKRELLQHVRDGDKVGKKIIEIELNYLQSLKNITQSVLNNE